MNDFHPVVSAWFQNKFGGRPTPVQEQAWAAIQSGLHTLIASPTGSGKTLAALLPCLDAIAKQKEQGGEQEPGVRVLYVTPLKALNNDIQHHALQFLQEMEQLAEEQGLSWPGIRAAVRTGDTTSSQRASMLKQPPELLMTTPESFYILMTSQKGRNLLRTVEKIIVDEIHDLAADKRGVHLSLTLERHAALCGRVPQRIGVSATQRPLERVARYLGGWEQDKPRDVAVVEAAMQKKMELRVQMPEFDGVLRERENFWDVIVAQLVEAMQDCATALVFVNNRRLCERLTLRLNDFAGAEIARSHHSSVSKDKRLEVERMLKAGQLKCLVATSSLELGIDVGHVDLVIQVDSPKGVAGGVQRFGRAGHQVDGTSRGLIVAKNRHELIEIAVLSKLIAEREIEEIQIPRHALDVLSQQVVAIVAMEPWSVDGLVELIGRSDCYRDFPRARLVGMLDVLSGFYPFARPQIDWNRETGLLTGRKSSAISALMGAGTIPSSGSYPVHHLDTGMHIGELDEEFVHESRVGDVFQLGTSSWMFQSIRHDRVFVTESANSFSEIPFWKGDGPGRSHEMGRKIGAFLEELRGRIEDGEARKWLEEAHFLEPAAADYVIATVKEQAEKGELPTARTLVVEQFRDDLNHAHVVIHSLFGKRVNRTWMLALQRYLEQTMPQKFDSFAKDNGIQFVFPDWEGSVDVFAQAIWQVTGETLQQLLLEAIPGSSFFAINFRRLAETSLLLSRGYSRTPLWMKRVRSEELLREALPYAEKFPLIEETMRVCLNEQLDVEALQQVLADLEQGNLRLVVQESRMPSPFARQYLAEFMEQKLYESDVFGRDVQLQLMSLHKDLAAPLFGAQALQHAIDAEVLADEQRRLQGFAKGREWRAAEDVYRLLKERGDLTMAEIREVVGECADRWLGELQEKGQIAVALVAGEERFVCRDEQEAYASYPEEPTAATFVLGRFMRTRVSFTEQDLGKRYALPVEQVRQVIADGVAQEQLEEAPFGCKGGDKAWTSRSVLSRLIRATLQKFRKQAEPASAEHMLQHMLSQHHLAPNRKLQGAEGLREIIGQLQGLFLPLAHWEAIVFPARMVKYRKEDLDLLCASGDVLWIGKKERVAFFLTEAKELYAPFLQESEAKHPELLDLLEKKGASFLASLNRELGVLPSELLDKLFDLVWDGQVSNDQFAPLRFKTQAAKKGKGLQAGVGRWYGLRAALEQAERLDLSAMAWVQQLLKRHCVVAKATVEESAPFGWNVLQEVLAKLEEWGTVSRGIFVRDLPGMQFSTKEMVAKLRQPEQEWQGVVLLSSVDPANPFGSIIQWPERAGVTFSRKPGNFLVVKDGKWVMWVEGKGKRLRVLDESVQADKLFLRDAFRALIQQQGLVKLVIESWNGAPVLETDLVETLRELGGERDRTRLVFWSTSLPSHIR